MITSERFKRLELFVAEAAKSLKETKRESAKLSKSNQTFANENDRLKEELRRFSSYPLKQKRLKERLGKILHKLDKIAK
jgi:regulator of replication initiation timing